MRNEPELEISDHIAQCCINKYESFQKRFKPSENQWTILAGIVIEYLNVNNDNNNIKGAVEPPKNLLKCVSLGTGMKCLGKSYRLPTGEIINDSHAEVLSRRAFQKYIYSEIQACINNKDSIFEFNKKTGKFKIEENIRFHLYVSQAPCGDASTISLSELQTEEERIINENKKRIFNEKQSSIKQVKLESEKVLRGRLNYDKLGILRTKPGRIDADPTLSMSCSDKILKWTYLGITGSLLMYFLEKPIYLYSVTVEDMYDEGSLQRALITRCGDAKDLPLPYTRIKPKIWNSSHILFPYTKKQINQNKESKEDKNSIPSNNDDQSNNKKKKKNKIKADDKAIYWSLPMNQPEIIINGRKQGASPKNGVYHKKTWSDLCKYKMFSLFLKVYQQFLEYKGYTHENKVVKNLYQKTYQNYKDESVTYLKAKSYLFYGSDGNDTMEDTSQTKIIKSDDNNEDKDKAKSNEGILNGWTQKPIGFQNFKIELD